MARSIGIALLLAASAAVLPSPAVAADPAPRALPAGAQVPGARDFDGDGKADVLGRVGEMLYVWLNQSATFPDLRAPEIVRPVGWAAIEALQIVDVDSDGRGDLLGRLGDKLYLWPNTSTPGQPSLGGPVELGPGWRTITSIGTADLNNDGRPDLVALFNGFLYTWPNTGTPGHPSFGGAVSLGGGWATVTRHVTDIDGDGDLDVIGRLGDKMYAWLNTVTDGVPALAAAVELGAGWGRIEPTLTVDLDADGRADLVGRLGDTLYGWLTTGSPGHPALGGPTFLGSGWGTITSIRTGDIDGDGRVDLTGMYRGSLYTWRNLGGPGHPALDGAGNLGHGWGTITLVTAL